MTEATTYTPAPLDVAALLAEHATYRELRQRFERTHVTVEHDTIIGHRAESPPMPLDQACWYIREAWFVNPKITVLLDDY